MPIISSAAKKNLYTVLISFITAVTGVIIDPDGRTLTLIGGLSGVLLLLIWGWLSYETGLLTHKSSNFTIMAYWLGLPVTVFALNAVFKAGVYSQPLILLSETAAAMLFSSNYLFTFLCIRFGISVWWGTVGAIITTSFCWVMGRTSRVKSKGEFKA